MYYSVFVLIVSKFHNKFVYLSVGLVGGMYMELYVLQHGKETDSTELKKLFENKTTLTDAFLARVQKRYSLPLWLHLAVTLHNLNQLVVLPLTMWMMLQEYRGLSRLGRQFCNYVGLSPSLRNYDDLKSRMIQGATAEVARTTSSGRCIVSVDNYTHQYGSSALTTRRRTQYHLPTYTVGAVIEWPSTVEVNIDLRQLANGTWLSSIPEDVQALQTFVDEVWFSIFFFLFMTFFCRSSIPSSPHSIVFANKGLVTRCSNTGIRVSSK